MAREPLRVDRGGRDDDPQVGPTGQQAAQVAQQEVDVQAALVGLVHDQGVVGEQLAVGLDLGQQDAVRHQLDGGLRPGPVTETHLVPHETRTLGAELLRDPGRDRPGGDAPGLGVPDDARDTAPEGEAELGQLGGLARPRLATHDRHGMGVDRLGDRIERGRDRKRGRELDGRHPGVPFLRSRARGLELRCGPLQVLAGRLPREDPPAQREQGVAQPLPVSPHAAGELPQQRLHGAACRSPLRKVPLPPADIHSRDPRVSGPLHSRPARPEPRRRPAPPGRTRVHGPAVPISLSREAG